ncbi:MULTISPECIES: arginyltransferase [unclassified Brevundimonas]|uniref:arginyltransferase n=1 Tax=unclassified Brevundimonas TaxID=2622653 RepID=UPI0025BB8DD0|nr:MULTISPECIES: arginyltransferase [unclassified Brevundimonas]
MTEHIPTRQLKFYVTAEAPCPYLSDRMEKKVFAHLPFADGADVNDALSHAGFRRSQNIAYRPACEKCAACVSVRIPVGLHTLNRTDRKIRSRNADLVRTIVDPVATEEQYDLLKRYLSARHPEGGMNEMSESDFVTMIEDSSVRTHVIEYRLPVADGGRGPLVGFALIDVLSDGLSMVYSAFDPEMPKRSLGRNTVLDHIDQARRVGLAYLYLGYWVKGSPTMDYKASYRPLEGLTLFGWQRLDQL